MGVNFALELRLKTLRLTTITLLAIYCFAGIQESYGQQDILSVCFLDLDMPLSQKEPDKISSLQGLYFDLGKMMADKMGKEFDPYFTMTAFHKRPVRAGLLVGNCRLQFGLPHTEGPDYIAGQVTLTQPILQLGYALVVPTSTSIDSYRDLMGKKIGVQTGSPPQMALASMENVKLEYFQSPELALEALSQGRLDAAFIWGPTAGYQNRFLYESKFTVIPTTYEWPVSLGVHYDDKDFRKTIDQLIDGMSNQIDELKVKYAFPEGEKLIMPKFDYDF